MSSASPCDEAAASHHFLTIPGRPDRLSDSLLSPVPEAWLNPPCRNLYTPAQPVVEFGQFLERMTVRSPPEDSIHCEFSLPAGMTSDGTIEGWLVRVMLGTVNDDVDGATLRTAEDQGGDDVYYGIE